METSDSAYLLVFTNCPDRESATSIATTLLKEKLAACVNVMPEILSLYRWQGKQEMTSEVQLQIKTRSEVLSTLQQRITSLHPYDLPEIIAIPIVAGLPAYLQWIHEETGFE